MRNIKRIIIAAFMVVTVFTDSIGGGVLASDDCLFETRYVSANSLNCRTSPTTNDDNIITVYDRGTEIQTIGIDNTGQWLQTWDGTIQGWCYSAYLVQNKEDLNKQVEQNDTIGSYLGNFKITGYTPSPAENGGYSVTCMGDNLWDSVGWAIAVDPKVIPLGTKVYIKGIGYRVARDTGGAIKGNKIDVLTSSNAESYSITGYYDVYLAE